MKKRLFPWLCALVIRLIASTLRMSTRDQASAFNRPDREPVIYAFWHNRLFLMAYFFERYNPGRTSIAFISRSRDGEFISSVAQYFKVYAARGSSSRHGAAAALKATRAAQDPRVDLAITPDGPRGPVYRIQPGLLRMAQSTGRPIVAVTFELAWKRVLPSWDRFQLPIPFSKCRLLTEPRVQVPADATDAQLDEISRQLEQALGGD